MLCLFFGMNGEGSRLADMLREGFELGSNSRMKILAGCLNFMTRVEGNGGIVDGKISEADKVYCELLCMSSPSLLRRIGNYFEFTEEGRKFYRECYGR